jgi:hypothetical protein
MISSLKLKFDRAPRRSIFLSADKLSVYHWVNGKLKSSYLFDVSADGQKYFDRYLKETGRMATWFLVDLVEEEYRQDTIPHVFGGDRKAVIDRKKMRLFRETPYFHADIQDRETDGRKDDRALFMGLTNPDLITPWIKLLAGNKIPLAGIYSVPQLTKLLINYLPDPAEHMLVISLQSISGLRQTFFLKKHLKISRLVDMPRYGTHPFAPIIAEEVEIIRRYLNSMRLIDVDKPLHIYYLADQKLLGEIRKLSTQTPSIANYYIDVNTFGELKGNIHGMATPFSDQLFNYHLLKLKPGNYYAQPEETRYFRMLMASRFMYAASVCMILGGMVWGGMNFMDAVVNKKQAEIAAKKSEFYSARYQLAREKLPATPVSPAELQLVVDAANTLNKHRTDPFDILEVISKGMDQYPQIQIDEISLAPSADPNRKITDVETVSPDQGIVGVSNIGTVDTGYNYYQIASMRGHISQFDGNYRLALDMINSFAETLRNLQSVHDVSIVTLPLDVSSTASLQGASNAAPGTANFSVRLVLGIRHES